MEIGYYNNPSECFEMLRILFDLFDGCDFYNESLDQHAAEELQFYPVKTGSLLYFFSATTNLLESICRMLMLCFPRAI